MNIEHVTTNDVMRMETYADVVGSGRRVLDERRLALCVLAGGAATRMGGTIKALVEIVSGMRFIDYSIKEAPALGCPLWIMTSADTNTKIAEAVKNVPNVRLFEQSMSPRMRSNHTPFRDEYGQILMAPAGHGDFQPALAASGILGDFCARGGRYVMVRNVDNLMATINDHIIGAHVNSGAGVTFELVERCSADRGGVPAIVDGRKRILESFEITKTFMDNAMFHNTNTCIFSTDVLLNKSYEWTYHPVTKTVAGDQIIQHERLIHEMTKWCDTSFVVVPRDRYLQVKTAAEFETLRSDMKH